MTSGRDVPPDVLIKRLSNELKEIPEIQPPEWAKFVKLGVHKEYPPENPDWWYVRAASVLRKIYLNGPIGVQRLRLEYGGLRNRGVKPEHFFRGSGNIIRKILQQLEKAELVEKDQSNKGRKITPKGTAFIDHVAHSIVNEATA